MGHKLECAELFLQVLCFIVQTQHVRGQNSRELYGKGEMRSQSTAIDLFLTQLIGPVRQ